MAARNGPRSKNRSTTTDSCWWNPPTAPGEQYLIRITATDQFGNQTSDQSDATFTLEFDSRDLHLRAGRLRHRGRKPSTPRPSTRLSSCATEPTARTSTSRARRSSSPPNTTSTATNLMSQTPKSAANTVRAIRAGTRTRPVRSKSPQGATPTPCRRSSDSRSSTAREGSTTTKKWAATSSSKVSTQSSRRTR